MKSQSGAGVLTNVLRTAFTNESNRNMHFSYKHGVSLEDKARLIIYKYNTNKDIFFNLLWFVGNVMASVEVHRNMINDTILTNLFPLRIIY